MKRILTKFVPFLLLLPLLSHAQIPGLAPEKNWDLNGYVKYMATSTIPNSGDAIFDNIVHQRFNFEYRFNDQLRVNLSMRNRLLFGDSAEYSNYSDFISYDPGYVDLSKNWIDKKGMIGNTQFDRAYLNWNKDDWQFRAGRFRINWGMTTVWNPNDIFNSYSIYDFDYEERPGTDAVMVSKKLGFASSIDLVFNPSSDSELDSYAARYLFNKQGWDMQVLLGKSQLDYVVGAGFAGDIYGAGLRGEFSWFEPTQRRYDNQDLVASSVSSLEMDYRFNGTQNWVIQGSLMHISEPQDADNAMAYLNLPLSARTLSFTRWTWYSSLGVDLSPLSRLTFMNSYYDDGSFFVGVNQTYSLADDWQLIGVVQYFDGASDSVFGENPSTLLYAQIKWSF
ncbi:hypothetical protein PVK64_11870 [Aliivibrio sp. S4TY2]|uniref:hypothetical protein n=1 Tax=unclassified Aliivibrio TaxID=2645654 RepID=UPI002378BD95|nr:MULTISPECIES: hypothetical protein [unclassified Aliivibrio]MDD9156872.1 hypothetical protein [Aliivibrio sp. S4TY2]MDD9160914.1 hypothetical protein [Aliivibrio sp. S4TY1]MDD9164944.1 hypothetical protein [Aliivibrio sp. S4MY2]MDD9168781.1 hypothetical protein [Aliivibrio sp. S4MY4]MDD9185310.1 hypothetical protein [Aliivibrio sp. S4MY3]